MSESLWLIVALVSGGVLGWFGRAFPQWLAEAESAGAVRFKNHPHGERRNERGISLSRHATVAVAVTASPTGPATCVCLCMEDPDGSVLAQMTPSEATELGHSLKAHGRVAAKIAANAAEKGGAA